MSNKVITKSDIIDLLSETQPYLFHRDAELIVKHILEGMSEALVSGDRIEVRGFGSFSLHHRSARKCHNPKTGEAVDVPAKFIPHFKPGKDVREKVKHIVKKVNKAKI